MKTECSRCESSESAGADTDTQDSARLAMIYLLFHLQSLNRCLGFTHLDTAHPGDPHARVLLDGCTQLVQVLNLCRRCLWAPKKRFATTESTRDRGNEVGVVLAHLLPHPVDL